MIRDLVAKNRSYRRFDERAAVSEDRLRAWVDLARLSASGANLQPLKYLLSNRPERNAAIFECLAWAGYLKDWQGPVPGERPAAYVIVLGDTEICQRFDTDPGIAAQSILLGAVEAGYGGCMVASIQRDKLRAALSIPERYCILLVIALGKPVEQVVLEPLEPNGNIQYWRDADGVHHVPKRALEDVLVDWDAGKELSG